MSTGIVRVLSASIAAGVLFTSALLAGDGVVALQSADPSCPDDSGRIYVACGNGTVTDNRSGLVWLANANCLSGSSQGGSVDWYTAMEFVAGLSDFQNAAFGDCGLNDGSSPGEWRLPSLQEWLDMVADAKGQGGDPDCRDPGPAITNNAGTACWSQCPQSIPGVPNGLCSAFRHVQSFSYWTASTDQDIFSHAWRLLLDTSAIGVLPKSRGQDPVSLPPPPRLASSRGPMMGSFEDVDSPSFSQLLCEFPLPTRFGSRKGAL